MLLTNDSRNSFERYGAAWVRAGGDLGELVPVSPDGAAVDRRECDGVVITGGADVEPRCYGELPLAGVVLETDGNRDALDLDVLSRADARGWPLLGICRGLQILNVHRGGSLFQDLDTAGLPGHTSAGARDRLAHSVTRDPGSRWLRHLPGEFRVNSRHHQGVCRLGDRLRVVAAAPDGVVEAIEGVEEERFVAGVQWHPEDVVGGPHEAVFRVFRTACERFAASRSGR
jgi:putative glutamine amidotransferase